MKFYNGVIHGITHFFMVDDKGVYFPDYEKKKKQEGKWIWCPTIVCPQRFKTFREMEEISPERANEITQLEIDVKTGRRDIDHVG